MVFGDTMMNYIKFFNYLILKRHRHVQDVLPMNARRKWVLAGDDWCTVPTSLQICTASTTIIL